MEPPGVDEYGRPSLDTPEGRGVVSSRSSICPSSICPSGINLLISVIIPTYNRRALLKRALESVFAQTYPNWEIIVVDDGSDDGTDEFMTAIASDRISFHRHERTSGGSAARNTGARLARGEYIAFLDSDDEWEPRILAKQVAVFERECEAVDVVYAGMELRASGRPPRIVLPPRSGNLQRALACKNVIGSPACVLMRRECFVESGGFDESLPSCQDWDLWWRLAKHCQFVPLREPLAIVYEDAPHRITGNVRGRLRGHRRMLETIRRDIQDRPLRARMEARFTYYFGRIVEDGGRIALARRFYCQAWVKRPTFLTPLLPAALTLLDHGTRHRVRHGIERVRRVGRAASER